MKSKMRSKKGKEEKNCKKMKGKWIKRGKGNRKIIEIGVDDENGTNLREEEEEKRKE